MRPALAALAEQQQLINNLRATAARQNRQIAYLTRGLQSLARMAGVENHVATAMLKRADEQNPAQPVPDPPGEPPTEPTAGVEEPEAFADVTAPGLVPGSTQDVAADATTTAYTPGQDVLGPAFKTLQDVTAPVDGTQGPRPLEETRTDVDVRVGDPMNPQTAYPLRGDFQRAQRTRASLRRAATSIAEAADTLGVDRDQVQQALQNHPEWVSKDDDGTPVISADAMDKLREEVSGDDSSSDKGGDQDKQPPPPPPGANNGGDNSSSGGGEDKDKPPFAKGSAASNRTMVALRLAKLRMHAGLASANSNEFTLASQLETDASLSTRTMEHEISTLENVTRLGNRRTSSGGNSRLVPRTASASRSVPSMQDHPAQHTAAAGGDPDDSDLFD